MDKQMKTLLDTKMESLQNKSEIEKILTTRLSEETQVLLEVMVKMEYESAYLYYHISASLTNANIANTGKLFKKWGDEELKHAEKHLNYIDDRCGKLVIPEVKKWDIPIMCIGEALKESFKHERMVSDTYISSYKKLFETGDITTLNHVSWYVLEQQEEESKIKDLIEIWFNLGNVEDKKFQWEEMIKSYL